MPEMNGNKHSLPEISVIVPCYNATLFVAETLHSILKQKADMEVLIVDDGSKDELQKLVEDFGDRRIKYHYQENQGVSAARNKGFELAQGKFVVFFDADDLMTEDFLMVRADVLLKSTEVDFVCGEVQKFMNQELIEGYFRGISVNAVEEILTLHPDVTTCPSNFMFRSDFLKRISARFNTRLSSTADKLFLFECASKGRPEFVRGRGKLLYRVSENSMSHLFSSALVTDNEAYYFELKKSPLIPPHIKSSVFFSLEFMLAGSFWKLKNYGKAFPYLFSVLFRHPIWFFKKFLGGSI